MKNDAQEILHHRGEKELEQDKGEVDKKEMGR